MLKQQRNASINISKQNSISSKCSKVLTLADNLSVERNVVGSGLASHRANENSIKRAGTAIASRAI